MKNSVPRSVITPSMNDNLSNVRTTVCIYTHKKHSARLSIHQRELLISQPFTQSRFIAHAYRLFQKIGDALIFVASDSGPGAFHKLLLRIPVFLNKFLLRLPCFVRKF